jgi:hypothetical protein
VRASASEHAARLGRVALRPRRAAGEQHARVGAPVGELPHGVEGGEQVERRRHGRHDHAVRRAGEAAQVLGRFVRGGVEHAVLGVERVGVDGPHLEGQHVTASSGPAGRARVGVAVEQHHAAPAAPAGDGGGEVHRGGRLAGAAVRRHQC